MLCDFNLKVDIYTQQVGRNLPKPTLWLLHRFLVLSEISTWSLIYSNTRTRYTSLAPSQIPDWIQNTVDRLQRTSWQSTYLHPRNDHPIKKQNIFHKIQWRTCPEGSKIQAWYFWQACIRSVWASGMELLAEGNWVMWWNWSIQAKPKDSSFCQMSLL